MTSPKNNLFYRRFFLPAIFFPVVTLLSLLFINTYSAQMAFEEQELRIQVANSRAEVQTLRSKLQTFESPSYIHQQAIKLGMQPMDTLLFLDLETGEVIGSHKKIKNTIKIGKGSLQPLFLKETMTHRSQLPTDDTAYLVQRN